MFAKFIHTQLFFLLLLYSAKATCLPPEKGDSLLATISKVKQDSTEIFSLLNLSAKNINTEPALAIDYAIKALELAERTGSKKGKVLGYYRISCVYYFQGNYKSALEGFFKCLNLEDFFTTKSEKAKMHNYMALIYIYRNNFDEALKSINKCFYICKTAKDIDTEILPTISMGMLYEKQNQLDSALKYYQLAITTAKIQGDNTSLAAAYNGKASVYYRSNNTDLAI